jgi:hypothetical protein
VSGFETWLTQLDRVQRNLAIVRSTAMWQSDVGLHFGFGLSAVVPAPLLDENALVYWGSHLVMSGAW